MGTVIIKAKLSPESPETNIDEWEPKVKEIISKDGEFMGFNKQPVGFGLNVAIIIFIIPDKAEGLMDRIENELREIEGVSDFRVESMDLE